MKTFLITVLLFTGFSSYSQLPDPLKIEIVRDSFGVPHIFAPTDAGVAYGLAYAHAEDDFKTIQTSFLAGKAMLGLYKGKAGAQIDYIVQLLRCRETAAEKYASDISIDYKKLLEGYCAGINSYAKHHKKEVLVKQLFPLTPLDMIAYSILQLSISSRADEALQQIFGGTVPLLKSFEAAGSNAYAFNSKKTTDGQTYLNINAHQPLEGPVSWYEAHLCSEEGWNITGALFPCAPSILLGTNANLSWAHTVNYPDKLDVFQLETDPDDKLRYKFDGEWLKLEVNTASLKVKIAGITVNAKRKIWWSKYGPTVVTDRGSFAIRTAALFEVRALEQWYRMNKAQNFSEFYKALEMSAIPGYNVMYADRFDTIFYMSNAKIPIRDKGYNWKQTIPGNSSRSLWTSYHPINNLPQYLNPPSGYLFNSNHSPFNASAERDNLKTAGFDPTMGYETWETNRSLRFMELIKAYDKINYTDFKKIKFDLQFPSRIRYLGTNSDQLFSLNETEYPGIAPLIRTLNSWDKKATTDSKGAAIFAIAYYHIAGKIAGGERAYNNLSKEAAVGVLTYVKEYLLKHFGKLELTLGEYQYLVRGDKAYPLPGLPDVIASIESEPWKNGRVKGKQGESFIQLVRYTKAGPEIETIHSYGASNKKENKHYNDQMKMFLEQKTKKMTLDKTIIYKNAERIYNPL